MTPVGGLSDAFSQQASRSGSSEDELEFFRINDKETAIVRFLEDGKGIAWCYTHPTPPPPGWRYGEDTPCLDQSGQSPEKCPGCQMKDPQDPSRSLERAFTGFINVLWYDGPVYGKKDNGWPDRKNVVARQDGIFTWSSGRRLFEEIAGKDATYKGLTNRKFRVTRNGVEKNTKYTIEPDVDAEGVSAPQPMTDAERALAATKPDLTPHITPLSLERFKEVMQLSKPAAGGAEDAAAGQAPNPFENSETPPSDVSAFSALK